MLILKSKGITSLLEIKSSYLVDSHCHLNFKDFNEDFDDVLKRAKESNIGIMVSISTEIDEIDEVMSMQKNTRIYTVL